MQNNFHFGGLLSHRGEAAISERKFKLVNRIFPQEQTSGLILLWKLTCSKVSGLALICIPACLIVTTLNLALVSFEKMRQ